ncbi:Uncharacterised protein [Klebsiella pneumoniae]|uniref:Uncharacterized protein n=1 Tax=Klebsiella pneumoniae TaxID=573 RepID=A0A378C189_KLEPN|nr:Uncharacterised protein [Klebsiella pneumoniae]
MLPCFCTNHNGIAIVLTDFQFNALRFIHRALNALTGYAARDRTCRRSQRASGTAADGVSKEPAQYRTANGPDGIAIVAAPGSVRRAYAR